MKFKKSFLALLLAIIGLSMVQSPVLLYGIIPVAMIGLTLTIVGLLGAFWNDLKGIVPLITQ